MSEALFAEWSEQVAPQQTLIEAPEKSINPCVNTYGKGPQGRLCKDCALLEQWEYHNKTYYKCSLRKNTHGAGSDHRKKWPACKRFQEEEQLS